jgi:hypothetical protein
MFTFITEMIIYKYMYAIPVQPIYQQYTYNKKIGTQHKYIQK